MRSSVITAATRSAILALLGATLLGAPMANAAAAGRHLIRHHKTFASETVRNANAFWPDPPNAFAGDPNGFGTTRRWPSGLRPDDWRQSVNGN